MHRLADTFTFFWLTKLTQTAVVVSFMPLVAGRRSVNSLSIFDWLVNPATTLPSYVEFQRSTDIMICLGFVWPSSRYGERERAGGREGRGKGIFRAVLREWMNEISDSKTQLRS